MARHKLENELIAIEVEEHGAELKSLVRKNTGKEYMWKADPKFWGRTSPVLFPFVGAVKEKQFRTKGQTYTMGQHGFARDMDFTLDSKTEVSQLRNRKLAEVFLRLRYIEAYGTGIRRIFAAYRDCPVQPSISVAPNSFRIVLPNLNHARQTDAPGSDMPKAVTPQMKTVLEYLSAHGEISDQELQELLGIKRTRAYTLAKEMETAGLIEISGRGAKRRLTLHPRGTPHHLEK